MGWSQRGTDGPSALVGLSADPWAPDGLMRIHVPADAPTSWTLQVVDGLVVWAFLAASDADEPPLCRPWLVVEERPWGLGIERLAVPRLMPQCEWRDKQEYERWHEQAWRRQAIPLRRDETAIGAALARSGL
jgi:hypothetical protein